MYLHDVFTHNYGQDLQSLIGEAYGDDIRQSEAIRCIREALEINPYQAQVEALTASVEGKTAELAEKDEQLAKKDEALAAANGLLAELEATYDEN